MVRPGDMVVVPRRQAVAAVLVMAACWAGLGASGYAVLRPAPVPAAPIPGALCRFAESMCAVNGRVVAITPVARDVYSLRCRDGATFNALSAKFRVPR